MFVVPGGGGPLSQDDVAVVREMLDQLLAIEARIVRMDAWRTEPRRSPVAFMWRAVGLAATEADDLVKANAQPKARA